MFDIIGTSLRGSLDIKYSNINHPELNIEKDIDTRNKPTLVFLCGKDDLVSKNEDILTEVIPFLEK